MRTKVAALVLGPAGLGFVGLLISVMTTAGSLASWGIGNVATRQIAEVGSDSLAAAAARRATLLAALMLASVGGAATLLLSRPIAARVLGDPSASSSIAWLGLGVAFLVLFNAAVGILTGYRRIGDVARASVVSAMLATTIAVIALLLLRQQAVVWFVLAGPFASAAVAMLYLLRTPRTEQRLAREAIAFHWRVFARLGFAFTGAAVVAAASQVALRSLVQAALGAEALGQFHASWQISTNYIGFILTAMAVDYYPRLTAAIGPSGRPGGASEAINHQAEVALLLAGPILVGTVGFARWIVPLLYSQKFLPLIFLLRWQIVGDFLKIASWALGMVMVAAGRGRLFILTESIAAVALVALTALVLPLAGLQAPGIAYVATNLLYFLACLFVASRIASFQPSGMTVRAFIAVAVALAFTLGAGAWSTQASMVTGALCSTVLALYTVRRLGASLPDPFGRWFGGRV